jgi:hypothetical protein
MNPLAHNDVDRYVKDLIDRHIPQGERGENIRGGRTSETLRRTETDPPADGEENPTA